MRGACGKNDVENSMEGLIMSSNGEQTVFGVVEMKDIKKIVYMKRMGQCDMMKVV